MGLSPDALYQSVYADVLKHAIPGFSGQYVPGCTYRQFACSSLLRDVVRKWIPSDSREADKLALDAFTLANNRCKDWRFLPEFESDTELYGEFRRILDAFFHPRGEPLIGSFFDILSKSRPGPGVNIGATGTSYYTKYFSSELTATSSYLYDEYRRYSCWIPYLSEAEAIRYDKYGPPKVVNGSRCSFVPKTNSGSRMICIEPTLNMYYQLGLATILEDRLKEYFGISLADQPSINHQLARQGSIDGTYCTIDLSSASDSVSLRLCEDALPKWFFELLIQLRSRVTKINGSDVPLFMVSTMGNGFTFPLQTIIFSAILKACWNFRSSNDSSRLGCFGDDLICGKEIFPRVIRLLKLLGFTPNPSKTFSEGPFRESCGSDWFLGQPVRSIFIKKLSLPFDFFVAINQLNNWSAYTGVPLRNSVQLLVSQLRNKFITYVPFDSSLDSGIRVPLALVNPRFDKNSSFLFKSWERVPVKIKILEGVVHGPGRLGNLLYNPPGLYCSFLFGELVDCSISIRHDRKIFSRKLRCSPYWDYIPATSFTNGVKLEWQRWNNAVVTNLQS